MANAAEQFTVLQDIRTEPSAIIAPSLLAADATRIGREVERAGRSGAEWLHIDIMDGNFVPNLSFSPGTVAAIRPLTDLFLDVHLMCARPEILLERFARHGADLLTVHVELGDKVSSLLWKIRSLGKKIGLAVNPPTSMSMVEPYLPQIDLLLVMTVNPGFGGQGLITETLPKVQQARAWRRKYGLDYRIEVDGGIDYDTAPICARAGADTFVSGTTLFSRPNLRNAVMKLRRLVNAELDTAVTAQRMLSKVK